MPLKYPEKNGLDLETAWESIPKLIAKILSRGLEKFWGQITGYLRGKKDIKYFQN
jgi:hypothetical protein